MRPSWSTKAGDLALAIPKLCWGAFFPKLLERRRRIDQALYAVVIRAYVNGVSTRSVDDLVAAMCVDTGSPSPHVWGLPRRSGSVGPMGCMAGPAGALIMRWLRGH